MISQLDIDCFQRDGFLVVRDVFSTEEMSGFVAAVDKAIDEREDKPLSMAERDAYARMFTQYYNLWETSLEVRALTFHPRLAQIASALLQVPELRVYSDQSFYKEPGSSATGIHQDYRLLSIQETRTLTAWIPLEGCSRDSGALAYLPGSHQLGRITNVDIVLGRDISKQVEQSPVEQVFVELAPGDVVFHHVLTFHLSAPNQSDRTRKAVAITYFAEGSTRGTAWPHASVDRAGIAVGERIHGPATPLVWPQQSALPQTPPPNPHPPKGWPGYKSRADRTEFSPFGL